MSFKESDFLQKLKKEVEELKVNGRDLSSNFLVWFLINYFRIDNDFAPDLVCDHKNDKGIDGIFVDEETEEIYVFQSKYRDSNEKGEGDGDLRKFIGTGEWITRENLENMESTKASRELKELLSREKVMDFLSKGFKVKLLYVTSGKFNTNADEYIGVTNEKCEYWDFNRLFNNYTYSGKDEYVRSKHIFKSISNIISYPYNEKSNAYILVIPAKKLLELDGIVDRSLFSKNVRYGLGRTNVNKEISKTIRDQKQHKNFLLYHNGITMIAESVTLDNDKGTLDLENYSIVNGCQSTLTLFENREALTDKLLLELKIVETKDNSYLSEKITYFANNQNPINAADLRSREKFQLDLQKKIKETYGEEIFYHIARGEDAPKNCRVVDKLFISQLLFAFKEEKSYDAHQKTSTFANYYSDIFTRNVNEHYIYVLDKIFQNIINNMDAVEEQLIKSYMPTRFFILYTIKKIMQKDEAGKLFLVNQKQFVDTYKEKMDEAFTKLTKTIIIQLNYALKRMKEEDGFINYKNIFRSAVQTKKLSDDLCAQYEITTVTHPESKLENLIK